MRMGREEFEDFGLNIVKELNPNVEKIDVNNRLVISFSAISNTLLGAMLSAKEQVIKAWKETKVKPDVILFRGQGFFHDNPLSTKGLGLNEDFMTRDILDIDMSMETKFFKYLKESKYSFMIRCGWEGIPDSYNSEGKKILNSDNSMFKLTKEIIENNNDSLG